MKKILLTLAVALISLGASAAVPVKKGVKMKMMPSHLQKEILMNLGSSVKFEKTVAPVGASKIRRAQADIYGTYVHTYAGDEVEDFIGTLTDTLYHANYPIEVTLEDNTTETVTCNVHFEHFGGYRIDAYGLCEADEEGVNHLIFPEQIVMSYKATDGTPYDCYLYGATPTDDNMFNINLLSYTEDETGSFDCDYEAFTLLAVSQEDPDDQGLALLVYNTSLKKVNGGSIYQYSGSNGWMTITEASSIVDYEIAATVYGWFNTKLEMYIDEDLTVRFPVGQPIYDFFITQAAGYEWDAGAITLCACTPRDEEGYFRRDFDAEFVYGKLEGDTVFIDVPFSGASIPNEDGSAYGFWFGGAKFFFNQGEGGFVAGIHEATMTREEKIRNTKTYNLMGQQVNRDRTKGILIRNGRKFINK